MYSHPLKISQYSADLHSTGVIAKIIQRVRLQNNAKTLLGCPNDSFCNF